MRPTFEKLLAELIKRAGSPDAPIRQEFHDGDVAHLQRWLDYGGANKTWNKISEGAFNSVDALVFAMTVLDLRRSAEKADLLNKKIPALERGKKQAASKARKLAIRKLRKNEITPHQYTAFDQRIKETPRSPNFFDPLVSNRSDDNGTRRRTLFCRMASDVLHHATGKWHDAEVAALCEIAFDCQDVTVEMVRSARRESTRKRR